MNCHADINLFSSVSKSSPVNGLQTGGAQISFTDNHDPLPEIHWVIFGKDELMKLETIEVSRIKEGYNPRQTFIEMDELMKSIGNDGLHDPILVRPIENGYEIVDGTRRFRSINRLGWNYVNCIVEELDDKEAAHLAFVKNQERRSLSPIEIAQHLNDMQEKFGYKVKNLTDLGYGGEKNIYKRMSLLKLPMDIQEKIAAGQITPTTGYELVKLNDREDIQRKFADEFANKETVSTRKAKKKVAQLVFDAASEVELNVPIIPKGDVEGVFFKSSTDMSEFEDKSVNLILTSPPYAVGMDYEIGVSIDEHLKMMNQVLSESARVLDDGGVLVLNFGDIHNYGTSHGDKPEIFLVGHHYQEMLRKQGIRLTDKIVWEKDLNWINNQQVSYSALSRHTSWRILNNSEHIWVFRKDGKRTVPLDLEYQSKITKNEWLSLVPGVWKIKPVRRQEGHPAQFPDELAERVIRMFSYKGDVVLDPFLGSGTTVKIARKLGRIGFGYEKNREYKAVIMKKLAEPVRSVGAAIAHRFDEAAGYMELDWSEIGFAMEQIKIVSPVYGQAGLN